VQSLLSITTSHAKEQEVARRLERQQATSELFGLLPSVSNTGSRSSTPSSTRISRPTESTLAQLAAPSMPAPFDWTIYDADFFALPWSSENDQGLQDFLQPGTHNFGGEAVADIPLFPIYDQQIDPRLG
jgi:hypothetical protein